MLPVELWKANCKNIIKYNKLDHFFETIDDCRVKKILGCTN